MKEIRNRIVEHRTVPARELRRNPRNWRRHPDAQRSSVATILEAVGWVGEALIVDTPDGPLLIDGHLRADLADDQGVPCSVVDLSPAEADLVLASLDALTAMAEGDGVLLRQLIGSLDLDDLAAAAELATADLTSAVALMAAAFPTTAPSAGRTDPDAVPEPPAEPRARTGDVWALGGHRLMCGDATKPSDVARLMAGALAAAIWTDPPYGVSYVGKTADALTFGNDDAAGVSALLHGAFAACAGVVGPGTPFYIAHPAGPLSARFAEAIEAVGWRIHETLVWVKDAMVLGHSDYHYRHEPIFYGGTDVEPLPWFMERAAVYDPIAYGWSPGAAHPWFGKRSETSVFLIDRPKASREHPTMKPTELIERCLRNSTLIDGIVLDPFVGSGSTIIAAERLGRRCYAMEIDPRYVDVAVRRWSEFTGREATLDRPKAKRRA